MADINRPAVTPKTYVSPLPAGTEFEFVSAYTVYPYTYLTGNDETVNTYNLTITEPDGNEIKVEEYTRIRRATGIEEKGENVGVKLTLKPGTYRATYTYSRKRGGLNPDPKTNTATYHFAVVENHYPLKQMTVKDTIERQIEICEPLMVFAYTPEYDAYCKRAAERLMEIEDEEVSEEIVAALYPSVGRTQSKYDNYTVAEYYDSIGNSLTKKRGRSGGEPIHFFAAMLYLMKQKYKLSNKTMSGIMSDMHNMTWKEWREECIAKVKPEE